MRLAVTVGAGWLLLLTACEARIGKDEGGESANASATAAASPAAEKSEPGKLSIKAPGFDMKIDIPQGMAERASMNSDDQLVYPGATLAGMHIEAGAEQKGARASGVELRFTSADPVERVAAWYRDPARNSGFSIASEKREGNALLLSGTQKSDGDPFSLRLSPASAGGTEGRLTVSDRN